MKATRGDTKNTLLLLQLSTRLFILNDVRWVCETGNVLKDYNFPGVLGKMHACVVSVNQALKKESLGTRLV